jgi:hypothetical protein
MKVILIYTPRSGSTSILEYFAKSKPDYKCYNEPWFDWMIENIYKNEIKYSELIKKENIFVKSALKTLPVSLYTLLTDFDKVIILLRKNKKEQVESCIMTNQEEAFLNNTPRKYNVYNITEEELKNANDRYDFLNSTLYEFGMTNNIPIFYYEDLYYGDFKPLFDELKIEYNTEYYNQYLNISKKYRIGDAKIKNTKSII